MEDPQKTPVLLNSTQALDLWGSVILTHTTGDTRELLDVTASARAAMRAWELMRHWELPRQTEFWQGEDSRAFSQWATAFESELRAENWITAAELPRELATRIESGQLHLPGPILQAGFEEVAPAVARLISVCQAKIRAAEKVAPTKIQCAGCADVTDELEQAARWARSHLEQNPAARIGIFVCGLAPLTSAAERIFDDVLRPGSSFSLPDSAPVFSVARGANCGEVPILRTALAVLGLLTGVHRSEAGAIWNSPYLKISRERLSRAETRLRTEGQDLVTWRSPEIQACLPRFEKAAQSLQGDLRPSQWAAAFSRLLKQCDWPGERLLNSTEKSALDQWGEILGQLASLDLIHSALNQHQAYERLRQIARGAQLAPAALAINAPVQILDIEDAGGLRFDAIWLAGLHDGAWPAPPRPNPFLPLKLQFAARVRHSTAEWELEHARRVMQQLATAAPVIVASYPKAASEEQLRPSPLLEKLKTAKLQTGVGWMEEMAVACEEVEDTKGPPVTNHGVQQGGR